MSGRGLFWPRLYEPLPTLAGQQAEAEKAAVASIHAAPMPPAAHINALIAEAHRLEDGEEARRTGADTRATGYLAVFGVLTQVLASTALPPLCHPVDVPKTLCALVFLAVETAYLLAFAYWAFRALQIHTFARVDAGDLLALWTNDDPRPELAKDLLYCVRLNRAPINAKLTCIRMAHAFGIRALFVFVAGALVRVGWDPVTALARAAGLGH